MATRSVCACLQVCAEVRFAVCIFTRWGTLPVPLVRAPLPSHRVCTEALYTQSAEGGGGLKHLVRVHTLAFVRVALRSGHTNVRTCTVHMDTRAVCAHVLVWAGVAVCDALFCAHGDSRCRGRLRLTLQPKWRVSIFRQDYLFFVPVLVALTTRVSLGTPWVVPRLKKR